MKAHVWVMIKPGEERRFASPVEPSPERAKAFREDGYRIVCVEFGLPPEFSPQDHEVIGKVKGRSK